MFELYFEYYQYKTLKCIINTICHLFVSYIFANVKTFSKYFQCCTYTMEIKLKTESSLLQIFNFLANYKRPRQKQCHLHKAGSLYSHC